MGLLYLFTFTKTYGGSADIYSSMPSETQHQMVVKCQLHALWTQSKGPPDRRPGGTHIGVDVMGKRDIAWSSQKSY